MSLLAAFDTRHENKDSLQSYFQKVTPTSASELPTQHSKLWGHH